MIVNLFFVVFSELMRKRRKGKEREGKGRERKK